ncbi:MAG: CPBP family intramembrane metalloprotease [Saprospiraceae bacterium]|nr:CPBP family intramembrane metalloprotease [Candidatus Vicinibacter affinis]MBK6824891.1 CPBP family intramembrane metalloprotease [Candidatus Vicinibacter affinis]MBK7800906.1 CPBP family intramembrane metalloprotease [Candidatus Vicinibacter affinis]MBK8417019.1 CPBP family intramembrane metalloprotease [Bacteroidota bacterium]
MDKKSIGQKILHFPLTKIIIGLLVCGVIVSVGQFLVGKLLDLTVLDKDIKNLIAGIVVAILAIVSYIYLYTFYEKREITEFTKNGIIKSLTIGIILGVVLQSLTILVIYLKGGYSIVTINPILFLVPPLTMAFTSAIFEETLMRGIIFRITEEKLGSYFGLIISAVIFGAMHLANPNSSMTAAIGLAIQAGLLLASAYIYARNLWFPIAIHFAWNFTQSAIFGANVSGNTISKTLVTSKIEGAEWFTGGQFGPEGSIQATTFCFIATVILLILSHKEGKIISPYWKK